MNTMPWLRLAAALVAGTVVACGGGGGGASPGDPPVKLAPTAVAAANRCAYTGVEHVFDGDGSSNPQPNRLAYAWTLESRPAGSTATLADADSVRARLIPDVEGEYTARLVVSDGDARSESSTATFRAQAPIAPPPLPDPAGSPWPVMNLATPMDGDYVFDCMMVTGAVASASSSEIKVFAKWVAGTMAGPNPWPGERVFETKHPRFVVGLDVASMPPGLYTLSMQAENGNGNSNTQVRKVLVTDDPALMHAPALRLPKDAQMHAADGTQLVHRVRAEVATLHDLAAGTRTELADTVSIQSLDRWQLSGGRVYASGFGGGCARSCIHEWAPDGSRTNLSLGDPAPPGAHDRDPIARNGFVVWPTSNGALPATYTLFDVGTRAYRRIVPAATQVDGADFGVAGGVVRLAYSGISGGSATLPERDIFRWDSVSGLSTRITAGGLTNRSPQTDGVTVAWRQTALGNYSDRRFTLMSASMTGGAAAVVSTAANDFGLRDGVLAWVEDAALPVIKARTAGGDVLVSDPGKSARLAAVGAGHVAYMEGSDFFTWNAATGVRVLRIKGAGPGDLHITGGALVYTILGIVYRVPL